MGSSEKQEAEIISILIVEDVDEMRSLVEHVLQGIPSVRVSGSAQNGSESRFEVLKRRPDLVFLDEVLPGESSYDLLNELSRWGIPVILMTSVENPPKAVPAPAFERVFKPSWGSVDQDRVRLKKVIFRALKRSDA